MGMEGYEDGGRGLRLVLELIFGKIEFFCVWRGRYVVLGVWF